MNYIQYSALPDYFCLLDQISIACNSTNAEQFTIRLEDSSAVVGEFTSGFTQENNTVNQVMKSILLVESLLNRHLEAVAFVTFANGLTRATETISFSKS